MSRPSKIRAQGAGLIASAVFLAVGAVSAINGGCSVSAERVEYARGEKAEAQKDWPGAVSHYQNVVDKWVSSDLAVRAAGHAARILCYETKAFAAAVRLYKHVVLYDRRPEARLEAQKRIAEIDFEHLLDYQGAITEYQRLLELPHGKDEGFVYRMAIARSYFYRSEFYQAQIEIDRLLKEDVDPGRAFDAYLLRANIQLTTKKLDDAIQTLNELIRRFPQRSKDETIGLVLAVCFEEQKNYAKAIETLATLKADYPRKDFIENRIKTLRERQSLLPGAHGLHK